MVDLSRLSFAKLRSFRILCFGLPVGRAGTSDLLLNLTLGLQIYEAASCQRAKLPQAEHRPRVGGGLWPAELCRADTDGARCSRAGGGVGLGPDQRSLPAPPGGPGRDGPPEQRRPGESMCVVSHGDHLIGKGEWKGGKRRRVKGSDRIFAAFLPPPRASWTRRTPRTEALRWPDLNDYPGNVMSEPRVWCAA